MDWYYVKDGQQQGPVSRGELERLIGGAGLAAETLVWCEGMAQWEPYAVAGARPAAAAGSPALAAPAAPSSPALAAPAAPSSPALAAPALAAGPALPNNLALAGLVLGIIGLLTSCVGLGALLAPIGLIVSIMGLNRARTDPQRTGHGAALTGLVLAIVAFAIGAIFLLVAVALTMASTA